MAYEEIQGGIKLSLKIFSHSIFGVDFTSMEIKIK